VNFGANEGLPKALADLSAESWEDIDALHAERAFFTQPQGIIKCTGGQYIQYFTAHFSFFSQISGRSTANFWLLYTL
jgi:hypothetical protein